MHEISLLKGVSTLTLQGGNHHDNHHAINQCYYLSLCHHKDEPLHPLPSIELIRTITAAVQTAASNEGEYSCYTMLVDSLIITVMESTDIPPDFSLVDLILRCLSLLQIITIISGSLMGQGTRQTQVAEDCCSLLSHPE